MLIQRAEAKYVRIAPRKVRLVADLIKGKSVEDANYILDNVNKRAVRPLKKVLNSAFANINQNRQEKVLSKDAFIAEIKAEEGPMLKRYRAATMGRATSIRHRTAHISVELKASEEAAAKGKTQKKKGKTQRSKK